MSVFSQSQAWMYRSSFSSLTYLNVLLPLIRSIFPFLHYSHLPSSHYSSVRPQSPHLPDQLGTFPFLCWLPTLYSHHEGVSHTRWVSFHHTTSTSLLHLISCLDPLLSSHCGKEINWVFSSLSLQEAIQTTEINYLLGFVQICAQKFGVDLRIIFYWAWILKILNSGSNLFSKTSYSIL